MDVATLVRSKNRCLQRLLELSGEFVAATTDGGHPTVDAALPLYQSRRDGILKAIELYDRKLSETVSALSPADRKPELLDSLRKDLDLSEALIRGILKKDEEVSRRIEGARADLMRDLAACERNKSISSKFKSEWITEPGGGLDRKI